MLFESFNRHVFIGMLSVVALWPFGLSQSGRFIRQKSGYKSNSPYLSTNIGSMSTSIFEQCAFACDINEVCITFIFTKSEDMCYLFNSKPDVTLDLIPGGALDSVYTRWLVVETMPG